ncbi:hypothetical protein OG338_05165 [Streptomyces sp. NBC_00726]
MRRLRVGHERTIGHRQSLVGEFRGVAGPNWTLRSPRGGTEWEVRPEHTRDATPAERLAARTARENARSRGEVA